MDACKPLPCTCAWYQCVPLAWSDTILYEYANEAAGSTLMNTLSCGESPSMCSPCVCRLVVDGVWYVLMV